MSTLIVFLFSINNNINGEDEDEGEEEEEEEEEDEEKQNCVDLFQTTLKSHLSSTSSITTQHRIDIRHDIDKHAASLVTTSYVPFVIMNIVFAGRFYS
jgi:hypothetical protein